VRSLLVPISRRLDFLPELRALPTEERRRLWLRASSTRRPNTRWEYLLAAVPIVTVNMLLQENYQKWFGSSQILGLFADLIRTVTNGLVHPSAGRLGQFIFNVVMFSIYFRIIGWLSERRTLRRLREMLVADADDS
jgi:hypothetical protein